ncbi:Ion transport protein-domain-containing protein, partial [Blyttiomyces helicus]
MPVDSRLLTILAVSTHSSGASQNAAIHLDPTLNVSSRAAAAVGRKPGGSGSGSQDLIRYLAKIVKNKHFDTVIIATVLINVAIITAQVQTLNSPTTSSALAIADASAILEPIFLATYTVEFLIKIVIEPRRFWASSYNCFDFAILFVTFAEFIAGFYVGSVMGVELGVLAWWRVFLYRFGLAMRSLRSFKTVAFIRSLKIVVNALLQTIRNNVFDILAILLVLMFIFGVLGNSVFGVSDAPLSTPDWGNLGAAFMTLWVFVCADGWIIYQEHLSTDGFFGSEAFTITFIVIGNFIIANLFIGVICQNIDEATEMERLQREHARKEAKKNKRELFLRKQRRDMIHLVAHKSEKNRDFQQVLQEMVGTLRHEDLVPMRYLACNLTWIETFLITLQYHENTMFRSQQTRFAIAHAVAEY